MISFVYVTRPPNFVHFYILIIYINHEFDVVAGKMSRDHMTNRQNEGIHHERNTMLRYLMTSQIPQSETDERVYDLNLHPRQEIDHNNIVPSNVGSFSNESIPPLGINPRPPTSSRDTSCLRIKRRFSENFSFRDYEEGESSTRRRVNPLDNNPNNNLSMSSTPFRHVINSSRNFNFNVHGISYNNFQSYEQGGSSSEIGMMDSWAPYDHLIFGSYQNPNTDFVYSIQHLNAHPSSLYVHNTVNIHQYVMISPTSHFVTPSPPNVQASSSSFNPLPSYVQQNQLLPLFGSRTCEQNQLFFSMARVGGNFEHILTSTSPQLRAERNRLRDQVYTYLILLEQSN